MDIWLKSLAIVCGIVAVIVFVYTYVNPATKKPPTFTPQEENYIVFLVQQLHLEKVAQGNDVEDFFLRHGDVLRYRYIEQIHNTALIIGDVPAVYEEATKRFNALSGSSTHVTH